MAVTAVACLSCCLNVLQNPPVALLQGRLIAPATCMLEMVSAAGKLLGSAADLPGGAAPAVTDASLSSPLLLPRQAAGNSAIVVCSLDLHSGRAQLYSAAATAVRQTVHLTAQLTRTSQQQQRESSAQQSAANKIAGGTQARGPALALAVLLVALRIAVSKLSSSHSSQTVAAGIDARCQAGSGYDTHPAVGDAAIHAGAAARAADDTTFLVSTAAGAYCTPQALPAGGAFASVRLSAAAADGSVVSGHRVHGSSAGGGRPGIAGVHARPVTSAASATAAESATASAGSATASAPRASAAAAVAIPDFDPTYVDPPPPARTLPASMPPLPPEFLAQVTAQLHGGQLQSIETMSLLLHGFGGRSCCHGGFSSVT